MFKTHDRKQKKFYKLDAKDGGHVTFGDNAKGKTNLDNLLDSQKPHGDIQGIGYGNKTSSSSSSHINFVKSSSHSTPSSSK